MAAFLIGTPVMVKASAKPVVARRTTTVRAAAVPECVFWQISFPAYFWQI